MVSPSIPIVSVVICLYNKVKEVGRAIDSVIAQSISEFELIIVDGGSTDGSLDVVTSYNDPRIRLIHQKSKGAAAGRNEGILVTKTDFITFLDADDTWFPDFLFTILSLREEYPDAGAYGTSGYICINGHYQVANHYGVPESLWEGYVPSYFYSMALGDPLVSVSAVGIPKAVFEKIGVFNICRWFEDVELFGRIAYYYPIAYSTYIGSVYYLSSSNKVTDGKPEILEKHPLIEFFEARPENELRMNEYYNDMILPVSVGSSI
jgi:glycosyltransferase involved in cell wall biosynthesis